MGLVNAPATFMYTMNKLFQDMLDFSMVAHLNDMLMYSSMVDENFILLEKTLVCLPQYTI